MNQPANIFRELAHSQDGESIETIFDAENIHVERIVSTGQSTPAGEWYDQTFDEWILLLTGAAQLRFEDSAEAIDLKPGDYLNIPAHRRHRVEHTASSESTIWLAIHYTAKKTS